MIIFISTFSVHFLDLCHSHNLRIGIDCSYGMTDNCKHSYLQQCPKNHDTSPTIKLIMCRCALVRWLGGRVVGVTYA